MPAKRADHHVRPADLTGAWHDRTVERVHLKASPLNTLCGRMATTTIGLDELPRLHWTQLCPTCLDACPEWYAQWFKGRGFTPHTRQEKQCLKSYKESRTPKS